MRESSPLCDGKGYRGRGSGTIATDAASDDDDEVASGECCCPTTAMTIADAANVNDDEATSGGRRRPMANVNDDDAGVDDNECTGRRGCGSGSAVTTVANHRQR